MPGHRDVAEGGEESLCVCVDNPSQDEDQRVDASDASGGHVVARVEGDHVAYDLSPCIASAGHSSYLTQQIAPAGSPGAERTPLRTAQTEGPIISE